MNSYLPNGFGSTYGGVKVAIPAAQRRPTIIRATTDALLRVLGVAADLMQVWSTVGGPIRQALGL